MLERLHDVDWARITHAYGPATDVPDLIEDLCATDPDRREKARWQLYGNIFHQGTRYEATAYAVPFLLEVLADPDGADKAELVLLLAAIAIGYDEYWLPDGLPIAEHRRSAEGGALVLAAAPHPGDEGWDEDEGDARYVEALSAPDQEAMLAHVAVAAHEAVRRGYRSCTRCWGTATRPCGWSPRTRWGGFRRTRRGACPPSPRSRRRPWRPRWTEPARPPTRTGRWRPPRGSRWGCWAWRPSSTTRGRPCGGRRRSRG
ncbi:hypothetical protein Psuf_084750 [Phytohabitans suffuscus]|uniref:HEAT repeat domain-containing protein n=1 Tax=Phytohabitans suffuscus TaxID=624315 RepID=A0A6F8YYK7_9ACTN|nr:hypothetical protein [Phytohabitans suffuscus]BCB91162.1 hypothetical protein Psuf_084750 [Phytohabitans suffuscus]